MWNMLPKISVFNIFTLYKAVYILIVIKMPDALCSAAAEPHHQIVHQLGQDKGTVNRVVDRDIVSEILW